MIYFENVPLSINKMFKKVFPAIVRKGIVQIFLAMLAVVMLFSFAPAEKTSNSMRELYDGIEFTMDKPGFTVFEIALEGYAKLKKDGRLGDKNILTIIDFSISSNQKRLWVIDLDNKKILHHTLVAHGRNTGQEFARNFSNTPESYKSSLGFYVTGTTYFGKHGLSLYLEGVEKGVNDNAKRRSIVMHGAAYVSPDFIKKYGRLGRSLGCPALPMDESKAVISKLASNTCLFIYYPDKAYVANSKLINENA